MGREDHLHLNTGMLANDELYHMSLVGVKHRKTRMEQRNVDCVVHDNLGLAVKISLLYNLGLAIKISLLFICKNLPDNLHLGCWDGCWA